MEEKHPSSEPLNQPRSEAEALSQALAQSRILLKHIESQTHTLVGQLEATQKKLTQTQHVLTSDQFKRLHANTVQQIDDTAVLAVSKISTMVRWFHWEKWGITLIAAAVTAFLTAIFVNDEWPWETHVHAKAERQAGQLLIQAWPQLTESEQIHLAEIAGLETQQNVG